MITQPQATKIESLGLTHHPLRWCLVPLGAAWPLLQEGASSRAHTNVRRPRRGRARPGPLLNRDAPEDRESVTTPVGKFLTELTDVCAPLTNRRWPCVHRGGHGVPRRGVRYPVEAGARRRSAEPRGDDGPYLPAARQAIVPVPAADDPRVPSGSTKSEVVSTSR